MKQSFAAGTLIEALCEMQANAELDHRMWSATFEFIITPGTLLIYEGEDGAFINWKGPDVVFCSVPAETHLRFASAWFGALNPVLLEPGRYRGIRVNCKEPQKCFRMVEL